MKVKMDRKWHGDDFFRRARRAQARGLVGIGEQVVRFAKINAHVISGTLRRSIHTAPVGYIGADDEEQAAVRDLPNATVRDVQSRANQRRMYAAGKSSLEVGSWISYACVEEVGRGHAFMTPAVEQVRPLAYPIMRQAHVEEGLLP